MRLFTRDFWLSAGGAVARTVVAAATPFILALLQQPSLAASWPWWLTVLAVVVPVAILAALNALAGLPVPGSGPWWEVGLQRAARQFGQFLVGSLPAALTMSFLHSQQGMQILIYAGISAIATFILAAVGISVPDASLTDQVSDQTVEGEVVDDGQDGTTEGTEGLPAEDASE